MPPAALGGSAHPVPGRGIQTWANPRSPNHTAGNWAGGCVCVPCSPCSDTHKQLVRSISTPTPHPPWLSQVGASLPSSQKACQQPLCRGWRAWGVRRAGAAADLAGPITRQWEPLSFPAFSPGQLQQLNWRGLKYYGPQTSPQKVET